MNGSPPQSARMPGRCYFGSRRSRYLISVLAAATLTAGTLSSCSPSTSAPTAECGNGKTLTVSVAEEPSSLDGNYDTYVIPAQISANLYDGLFTMDQNLKPIPNLATKYTQPNPTTYRLELRRGVKFHDGSPFTAADVVNSFDRISNDKKLASKQTSYVSNIASTTADGDYAVTFKLKEADASFIKALASLLFITPKKAIQAAGNAKFATRPVGTGPFKIAEWVKGDHLTMDANCSYWRGEPTVSRVVWRFVSEPATALASLQSGQTDMVPYISTDLAQSLKSRDGFKVASVPGVRAQFLAMNPTTGAARDPRVRMALNYAINRKAITKDLLKDGGVPTGQLASKPVFGFSPNTDPYPYDPAKAKQLLSEAGYGSGLTLTIYNDRPVVNLIWQAVADQLEAVGVKVKLKFDQNYFADTFLKKKMGANTLYLQGCSSLTLDADFCMGLTFDSKRRGLYFNSPETDRLITKARGESDPKARQATYEQLMQKLHDAAPVVFLYSTVDTYAMADQVRFTPRSDQKLWLWNADKS
ncbi:ABC transporter substrate-binding protein [Streptomyces chartreusis]|uniref:ABC transporter substrate-binding protein n=1 Tax=Streptomyces chartreusis TaxID=1969 RepID=UPI0036509862